jgi:hypothetical protein
VSISADPLPRNPGGKILKAELRSDVTWNSAPLLGTTADATPGLNGVRHRGAR